MKQGRNSCLILMLALLAWHCHAAEPLAVYLLGPTSAATTVFREALLEDGEDHYQFVSEPGAAQIVLALGEAAFQQALTQSLSVVGVHIPWSVVQAAQQQGCRCTAVYRDAPVHHQILLLEALLPGAKRIGVLLGPDSAHWRQQLRGKGYRFDVRELQRAEQLPAALAELLPRVDVLLALPDTRLFNAETARLILLSSYRQNKPVIGPDEAFVRAGSLAAAYPPASALVDATRSLLQHPDFPAQLPPPVHAASVPSVNRHVARSYGVIVPDLEELGARLEESP